nr:phospholipase-like protein [Tanacetum cinerariifolium]GEW53199.1 phospholipase-like protein [Tanacetum cinerariifolium]
MLDEDALRLCLLIASELIFMGKEKRNFLTKHIMWLVDDFDAWNAFPWGEYMWEKFYNRTVIVVSRHTEHHLAQPNNPNFNATYSLYGFPWAFMISNPNVALISSHEEMSQAWFKASSEFIKGLDDQDVDDGDGVLDSQSDDEDGVSDSQTKDVIEEATMLPTMSSNSPEAGNAAVSEFFAEFDALKKEVLLIKRRKDDEFEELIKKFKMIATQKKSDGGMSIEEKPNFSSHHNDSSNHIGGVSSKEKASSSSAHHGNDEDVSHLDDNIEINENPSIDLVVVVPSKVDDPMLRTIKPKNDFDEADVDSYDDDYMSLFNDEEKPAK